MTLPCCSGYTVLWAHLFYIECPERSVIAGPNDENEPKANQGPKMEKRERNDKERIESDKNKIAEGTRNIRENMRGTKQRGGGGKEREERMQESAC